MTKSAFDVPNDSGGDVRSSALWGTGNRGGEHRSNALWSTKTRGATVLLALCALVVPGAGLAGGGDRTKTCESGGAYVPRALLQQACAGKSTHFKVIVQGREGVLTSAGVRAVVEGVRGYAKRDYRSIVGVFAKMTGGQILGISHNPNIAAITPDSRVVSSAYGDAEMWRASTKVNRLWDRVDPATGTVEPAPALPAIAIVDTGIEAGRADWGGTLRHEEVICSLCAAGATGDGHGHGTMVATIAAGGTDEHAGAAKGAPLVSVRTGSDNGESAVSDVVAAVDWILANKDVYDIRVANFSLSSATPSSFRVDPMNKAVERLWLAGVVVVAAAGNHGTGTGPVTIKAPASDPFVISVGALDQSGTDVVADDFVPAWSAYGTSVDGFAKPELAAPGRYMVAAVPSGSTLANRHPDRVVGNGYMWMSGTSFAAPVVAGAAAQIVARHPEWTPDEVKGALMLTASAVAGAGAGRGEIDAEAAAALASPPNPNAALYQFVVVDAATGLRRFDPEAWRAHVALNPTWSPTSGWSESAWDESAWDESGWSESSWDESAWNESGWSESSWDESSWDESSWDESGWTEALGRE